MNKRFSGILTLPVLIGGLALPAFLPAGESPDPVSATAASSHTQQNSSQWARWLLTQVQSLPSFQALEKSTLVAEQQKLALEQPVYNPEIGATYIDREKGDEEYDFILSQTIDLFDKRSANAGLGQVEYEMAELNKLMETENRLAEALMAFIEYSMSRKLLDVSSSQEKLLTRLSADLSRREKAGDVGRVDAEMAYLSLSQNLQQISLTEIRFRKAKARLKQAINSSSLKFTPDNSVWLNKIDAKALAESLDNGFRIKQAQKQLEQAQSQSNIARLNKKVNPTIGLGAGRDSGEDTITFEISVPLNVRNNFSAQYNAALHKVNQSEFELEEQKRRLKNDMEQSYNNYLQLKSRVVNWQKLTAKRLSNSQTLLNRQWQSGDISTSDYLFALRQRTDALISTIELNGEMQKAWVEWLQASSQVQKWLSSLSH